VETNEDNLEAKIFGCVDRLHKSSLISTGAPIFDTYSFLLEHPNINEMDAVNRKIEFISNDFSKETYEQSRGAEFKTREEAYRDWVLFGKKAGLEFANSKNTVLKIVLKVKDEPFLLEKWIDYHANIVGFHNIIVMDCGSTDQEHWNIINKYKDRILLFKYDQYYDNLHSSESNRSFFDLISSNCKFLTVLDADEFLFGLSDDSISGKNVLEILNNTNDGVVVGTWFNNTDAPIDEFGKIDWHININFCMDYISISDGTFSGKSIVRSDLVFSVKHIGHNLHVPNVIEQITLNSFGKVGIFHMKNLGANITRLRVLKHLKSKGVLPDQFNDRETIEPLLYNMLENGKIEGASKYYAQKYLKPQEKMVQCDLIFSTNILSSFQKEKNNSLIHNMKAYDFSSLLNRYKVAF